MSAGPSGVAARRWPLAVLLLALSVGLLHLGPLWRAQSQTPAGWSFTGNLTGSPDVMQYRVLTERSQVTGPIVDNRMTAEPTRPHIAMLFYWVLGKAAAGLGVPLPFVAEYAGLLFAVLLVLVLFRIVTHFLPDRYQTWWVLLVLLFGGGLGAHLILLSQLGPLRESMLIQRLVTDGLQTAPVFELYRNHYLFTSIFDSHFLFFLLVALAAIFALYAALLRFSAARVALAALLFALATVLHLYEAVTLVSIAAGICFLLWRKGQPLRPLLLTLLPCAVAAGAALFWQIWLYRAAGQSPTAWRAQTIDASILLLAYPIAWGLLIWGLGDYWRKAGFRECFLLGWVLGCTVVTLSGPFYPYPDRGTITLQIPLYLVAGQIFFARWPRVTPAAAALAVFVLIGTPGFFFRNAWLNTSPTRHQSGRAPPYIWMSPPHRELSELLQSRAGEADVLLVEKTEQPWRTADLWLAPGFPGKLYAGHYALTPDYERKREATVRFFGPGDPAAQLAWLRDSGVRFVYVSPDRDPSRFSQVPGLTLLLENPAGALFEFREAPVSPSR